jgi:hypothetical protein
MVRQSSRAISDETPKAETKPSQNKVMSVSPLKLIFSAGGNGFTGFDPQLAAVTKIVRAPR